MDFQGHFTGNRWQVIELLLHPGTELAIDGMSSFFHA